jgi:PD-(D/E)XK endonuclease
MLNSSPADSGCTSLPFNSDPISLPAEPSDAPLPAIIPFIFAAAERPAKGAVQKESQPLPHTQSRTAKGVWVESIFQSRAIALGFTVYRPWGGHSALDFIIERNGRVLRIQVKSGWARKRYHYFFRTDRNSWFRGRRRKYDRIVDFIVGYVPPINAWYIIPAAALGKHTGIYVYPLDAEITHDARGYLRKHRNGPDYEQFREAWHLLNEAN